ncbi:12261_t:CDS:2, partial [Acaulospora colombiana]
MSLIQDISSEVFSNTPKSPKSPSLQRFERQLGGHSKLMAINDGSMIVKPCNEIERDFYELSYNSSLLEQQEEYINEEETNNASVNAQVFRENMNISGVEDILNIFV